MSDVSFPGSFPLYCSKKVQNPKVKLDLCDLAPSFQTLNKNNLLPDERSNIYQAPLQQANVYTTTYYPTALGKYDYQPNASPSPCRTYNHSNNS